MEERNVGTKRKCIKQGLSSAKDLTIELHLRLMRRKELLERIYLYIRLTLAIRVYEASMDIYSGSEGVFLLPYKPRLVFYNKDNIRINIQRF